MKASQVFRHSGKLGDIIYALSAVRAAGGGTLLINADGRYGIGSFEAGQLACLLQTQSYVHRAAIWSGEPYDIDLDAFRAHDPTHRNIAECHLLTLGLEPAEKDSAWLSIEEPTIIEEKPVVLARSATRRGVPGFWELAYKSFGRMAIFVGTAAEHEDFEASLGPITFLATEDALALARVIAGAMLFVGSQSLPYAIAESLKKPAMLEADPQAPNCLFHRPGLLPVISQDHLNDVTDFGTAVLRGELPSVLIKATPTQGAQVQTKRAVADEVPPWRRFWEYVGSRNQVEWAELVPPDAKRILHVGCGRGELAMTLMSRGEGAEVWGIERDPEMAREAKAKHIRVLAGDAERMDPLPLPERYFDCVVVGRLVAWLQDPEGFLKRLRPHLTDDAAVVCGVPNAAHWSRIAALLKNRLNLVDGAVRAWDHRRPFTLSTLRELLFDAGYLAQTEWAVRQAEPACVSALSNAARAMGLSAAQAGELASVLEWHVRAGPAPDPYRDEEKMRILLGPHVGKLGPASGRFSIIVLTYNSAKTIDKCVRSVLPTLLPEDELILVDNASQDGTQELSRSFAGADKRIRVILNDENLGFSAGCNVGLLASKGEYLVLLNPDTEVCSHWLQRFKETLGLPKVGAVGPVSERVSGLQFARFHVPSGAEPVTVEELDSLLTLVNAGKNVDTKLLIGFCLGTRRDTLDSFGLLDEGMFLGSEDVELSWRLRVLRLKLLICTDVLVRHETGVSFETSDRQWVENTRYGSDSALKEKVQLFYAQGPIHSVAVWGSCIFGHMLRQVEVTLSSEKRADQVPVKKRANTVADAQKGT